MRIFAVVVCCLAGGIATAAAQSVSPLLEASAGQGVVEPAAQPAEQQAAKPDEQPVAKPAEQQAAKTDEQPVAMPAEQQAAKTDEQPVAKPAEQQAAKPDEQPVAKPLEQQASKPADQPVAKPDEQQATKPQATKPDEQKVRQVAQGCPGNPDALGTSRVLTINPGEFSLLGTIQYKQTLPLKDHEVVLTFDDGPIPPYSNSILDTLDSQCVKATYFMVGEMARNYPAIVRRIYNAGHTIGTHSQHHPFGFQHLSLQRVEREVDGGIASVDAALGDPKAVSPFFRIPGLGRTSAIEHFLEGKGLVTWSADIDTNDWWRGTSPSAVVQRAMHRLNAKGRGILLMHDIHPATAMALPTLLKELKAQGYHVVQVVPSGDRPKAVPALVASPAEDKGIWPRVLRTSAAATASAGKAIASLRHRIKKLVASKRHPAKTASLASTDYTASAGKANTAIRHRVKKLVASKRHPAKTASLPDKDYTATAGAWQTNQY